MPLLERTESSTETQTTIGNAREQIPVLERVAGLDPHLHPHAHLEYFCNACLLRLHWHTKDWEGRRLAVADEVWQRHFRQVVASEPIRGLARMHLLESTG